MNEKSQIRYTAVGFARFSEADLGNNACYHTKSQIIVSKSTCPNKITDRWKCLYMKVRKCGSTICPTKPSQVTVFNVVVVSCHT